MQVHRLNDNFAVYAFVALEGIVAAVTSSLLRKCPAATAARIVH